MTEGARGCEDPAADVSRGGVLCVVGVSAQGPHQFRCGHAGDGEGGDEAAQWDGEAAAADGDVGAPPGAGGIAGEREGSESAARGRFRPQGIASAGNGVLRVTVRILPGDGVLGAAMGVVRPGGMGHPTCVPRSRPTRFIPMDAAAAGTAKTVCGSAEQRRWLRDRESVPRSGTEPA